MTLDARKLIFLGLQKNAESCFHFQKLRNKEEQHGTKNTYLALV